MAHGLHGVRRPRSRFWTASAVLAAGALAVSAGTIFSWDRRAAKGTPNDAIAASWFGDSRTRRQAITTQSEEVNALLNNLVDLSERGDEQARALASAAIAQARSIIER